MWRIIVKTISTITITMITNQNWVNKYLLRYSLFLKFSQTLYINWIAWSTEYDTIYKNSKLKKKKKEQKMHDCALRLFILNNCNSHIYFTALMSTVYLKIAVFDYTKCSVCQVMLRSCYFLSFIRYLQ